MFFLIPLLFVGAILIGRHSAQAAQPSQARLPSRSVPAISSGAQTPSPLAVLTETVRAGLEPPPMLIMCAIAEAEARGELEIVHAIVDKFIAPVVYAAEANAARNANTPPHPMDDTRAQYTNGGHVIEPSQQIAQPYGGAQQSPVTDCFPPIRAPRGDDGQAMFVDPAHLDDVLRQTFGEAPQAAADQAPTIAAGELGIAAMHAAEVAMGRAPGSVIRGVAPDRWATFVGQISRESPTFSAPRHVGQFRHRKDRLIELGIDPESLIGHPRRQVDALETDLRDAYHHARASGMDGWVGSMLCMPTGPAHNMINHQITLSGILGVIQAAGLEGAADWFETDSDRIRFPHTTQAFLRANGVF